MSCGYGAGRRGRWREDRGQAAVELVALLSLLIAAALVATQVLLAGIAQEQAGHAAEAGAVAIVQGGDPLAAARAAVSPRARDRLEVRVDGRRVDVDLEPPSLVGAVARLLTAHQHADAGPS